MSQFLVSALWGYQTICPDEENVVGLYKPEDHEFIEFYYQPSYTSKKYIKYKSLKHENWKHEVSNTFNKDIDEINLKFGNIYNIDGLESNIHTSIKLWGWDSYKDQHGTQWIKISDTNQIWAPLK